ncbi:unnamed protein product [Angiostrongylus costaricensis]|uniref:Ion_trans_2 domain-containing protein n=1 Tax=Angiostrongylus costaricensis TaxID=334426 RepID=A0A0R3PQD5_ANGCS|nr:unnamed protein product [Angiostrongylus costaricensis]
MAKTKCLEHELDQLSISEIDECYEHVIIDTEVFDNEHFDNLRMQLVNEEDKWSFGNSLIFTFSVITTIGYGHIAPETFYGRIFCIIFGLIGVPLTLLTIANLGMFISVALRKVAAVIDDMLLLCGKCSWSKTQKEGTLSSGKDMGQENEPKEMGASRTRTAVLFLKVELKKNEAFAKVTEGLCCSLRKTGEAVVLGLTFACYLVLGAQVLAAYEPEMDFFNALYFNFVTLTTIGLGDFVPRSFKYLFLTLCYIGIGLALTTMTIELAADILRKLHYVGRKMDNVASAVVWFGGKKMTMKRLIKNLGDQFNIPEEEMASFNLNNFIESAMKVEAGELKTLRKPVVKIRECDALSFSKLRDSSGSDIYYVDDRLSKRTG